MPVRPNLESLITSPNSQSPRSSNAQHQSSDVEETDDSNSTSDEDSYDYPPTQQHPVASSIHRVISADSYSERRPRRSYSPAQSTSSGATSNTGAPSEVSLSSSRGSFPYRRKTKDSIPVTYELVVVQQPSTAAEFGNHGVSRIPIAPPLMVQLIIRNSSGQVIPADDELAFLIAHVTLHKAALPNGMPDPQTSGITGTTTANAFTLNDLNQRRGNFFIFPDIGIQVQGIWRLQIKLMRIAAPGASSILSQGGTGNVLTCTWTEPFEVVPVEGYIAPKVTDLTRHFQGQGVRMFMSNSVVIH